MSGHRSLFLRRGITARPRAATTPTFDAATQSSNGTIGTTLTWTHTVGASLSNSALIVAVGSSQSNSNNPTVSGVTFGGVALAHLGVNMPVTSQLGGTERFLDAWYLLSPAAGAASVVITMAAAEFIAGGSVSLSSVNQSSPFGTPVIAASTSTNSPSTTVTGTASTDLILSTVSARTTVAPTGGGGQTQRFNPLAATNVYLVGTTQPGGGSITSSFSWTTADNSAMASLAIHGA